MVTLRRLTESSFALIPWKEEKGENNERRIGRTSLVALILQLQRAYSTHGLSRNQKCQEHSMWENSKY